jgi:hypothetical protein
VRKQHLDVAKPGVGRGAKPVVRIQLRPQHRQVGRESRQV